MYVLSCVGKDSPGSESDGGESRSDSGEIQPKKVIYLSVCLDKPFLYGPRFVHRGIVTM